MPFGDREAWILIVEDDESDLEVMRRGLRKGGWAGRLVVARSCPQALAALDAEASLPRLMVIDQGLPGEKGVDLLGCIREDARYAAVRAVLTSGHRDERIETAARRLKAEAFVEKPMDYREYVQAIAAIVPHSHPF